MTNIFHNGITTTQKVSSPISNGHGIKIEITETPSINNNNNDVKEFEKEGML